MVALTHAMPATMWDQHLAQYLRQVHKFPMLDADEEFMLAKRWRAHNDPDAGHLLVTSHLRLVAKIARNYRGFGLPMSELIAEGNLGMISAVKRFDPDRGFRLTTYAIWWIRAAIQEYILHSWSLVKIGTTAAQKKLFCNLRRLKGQIKALEDGDLAPEQIGKIAERLKVSAEDVVSMNRRLAGRDRSLNAPLRADSEGEWQDWLVDDRPNQEMRLLEDDELAKRRGLLDEALAALNDRERRILVERRLKDEPATLDELSQTFRISCERVRQIEVHAFEKLQKSVRNAARERRLAQ
jgi:RNA polymerase sigma-32 factor